MKTKKALAKLLSPSLAAGLHPQRGETRASAARGTAARVRNEQSALPRSIGAMASPSSSGSPTITLLNHLTPGRLKEVLTIENECFPPCERLGTLFKPFIEQRSNGLLLAELGSLAAGYLVFSRTAATTTGSGPPARHI